MTAVLLIDVSTAEVAVIVAVPAPTAVTVIVAPVVELIEAIAGSLVDHVTPLSKPEAIGSVTTVAVKVTVPPTKSSED